MGVCTGVQVWGGVHFCVHVQMFRNISSSSCLFFGAFFWLFFWLSCSAPLNFDLASLILLCLCPRTTICVLIQLYCIQDSSKPSTLIPKPLTLNPTLLHTGLLTYNLASAESQIAQENAEAGQKRQATLICPLHFFLSPTLILPETCACKN